ncbi:cytochrome P450 726A27-like [Mercurialis annua]|uniref:cytochrome P450 726A27-like n=1 Tax=Mercurialis annua TaxID=3986 RepID=UPI00215E1B69|nr:cytochrome P450 726A27-like [Mercurialis annua]
MDFQFPILVTFLFIFMLLKIVRKKNSVTDKPPPGPWKLPLIGNIHQVAGHQPHQRLTELAKTYGPVMSFQLGQLSTVIISSSETAQQVLKTHETNFVGRPALLAADIMLYNRSDISFAPYGDHWRFMRKIAVLQLLSAKRVQSFKPVIEEQISSFIDFLYSKGGSPVNLSKTLCALGNSVIAITSIGKKFKKQDEFLRVIDKAIRVSGGFCVADAFPSFKLIGTISGSSSVLNRAHEEADRVLEEVIGEHKADRRAASETEPDNVLDVLLDIQETSENLELPITTDNIKAVILDFFGGAGDTSLVTVEWAMAEMIKNPSTMQKAQEEVRRVFSENGKFNDESLHYLKLVIKETLRLHPPVALIPRESGERYQMNGYDINPKTKILINAWAIGRDSKSWANAEKFDPERFVDSSVNYMGNNFEFVPFGAGKRMCPGIVMAMAIIEPLLARMLLHFQWKLPNGAEPKSLDMADDFGLVVKRKIDLNLIPIPFCCTKDNEEHI